MSPDKKKSNHIAIEKQLTPRLRWIGYLLLTFSIVTISYSFFLPSPKDDGFDTVAEQEVSAGRSLQTEDDNGAPTKNHYYLFSSVFAAVGFLCIAIANRKKAKEV